MKRIPPCILALIVLISCSTSQETVKHAPAVPMQNYSTIAIAKFVSPDLAIGQRVAERLAVKFAEAGFTVTRYEKIKKLSGRDILTSPELTPVEKAALQASGIKAVLYGNIDSYECQTQKEWTWTGFAPEKTSFEICRASLSIRVVDAATGEIIWQTQGANSEKAAKLTARMVMERVLSRIEEEIPKINK
jgi:curli biogenesis system outer membrane secretion channel CsgG